MNIRNADSSEVEALARLWYDGWQDAHAAILPLELARQRTLESFRERIQALLPIVRVAGDIGNPVGFCICKNDELYQLYVAANSRGTGLASLLMTDAGEQFRKNQVRTAWLACAIGNARAERFYIKAGWLRVGEMINRLDTPAGEFLLRTWRYEKTW